MFLHFFDALCCGGKDFLPFDFLLGLVQNATSQGVWGFGGEKPDFLRSKNVALCLFTSKAMAALRWFLPRENS